MAQRVLSFVVVFVLGFSGEIFSQAVPGLPAPVVKKNPWLPGRPTQQGQRFSRFMVAAPAPVASAPRPTIISRPIPADYYQQCLGIFCRGEWKLEKLTAVPFRFRLGSLDYVNYLESKPNALRP